MKKLKMLLKENKFFYNLYSALFGFILNVCKIFIKVDDSIILFSCFGGNRFDDSPRYIYEYILKNKKYDNYKLYWAFEDMDKYVLPKGKKLKNNSIKYFIIALKAKYWITNTSIERGLKFKSKETIYINTWHGTAIKKIEKDHQNKAVKFKVSQADVYFAQSKYDVEVFSRAFGVDREKIVIAGLPRNDELAHSVSEKELNDIKRKLNIPFDKKIILYMPTYREFNKNENGSYIKPPIDINKWKQKLGNDFVLLFRAHHETVSVLGICYDEFIYNVSDYEPLNDLLKVADILVSDYSSVMFDFSILERPIFSFAYDYDKYIETRGCYIDITTELPNGICRIEDELLDEILNCNYEEQVLKTRQFKEKYVESCGNATMYVDNIIKKKVLFTATVDSHILHFHIPYLKYFKEKGYEVHVATNGNEDIPYCDKKIIIPFERSPFKYNNLKAIRMLKKVIMTEKYDIIHTHTPMGSVVTRIAARIARKKYKTRVIYTAHGLHFFVGAPLKNWLVFYPVEKVLSKYTDDMILVNNEDYNLVKNKFHCEKVYRIHGIGVNSKKFDIKLTDSESFDLRKSIGLCENDYIIIYAAELSKRKNQEMLIRAIKELVDNGIKDVKVILPGLDSLNGYYQKIVSDLQLNDYIKFLGYRRDIEKLMHISNLAVATSRQEGLCIHLAEAMFCGLPCIATVERGHKELIQDGYNGYLVEQDNYIQLSKKIIDIKNDKKTTDKFIKNNNEVVKKYLIENVMKEMIQIYES